jgi:hypothetical protein
MIFKKKLLKYSMRIIEVVDSLSNTRVDNHLTGQLLRQLLRKVNSR